MRDAIFVVGMGRSGTSAMSRVLSLCGGALPLRVMEADHSNPAGYWEPQDAVELNDAFLSAHGSSWYDATLDLQLRPVAFADAERFTLRIEAFLRDGFEPDGPLVLKDPRIAGLLPHWIRAAMRLGYGVKIVHVFRNPADVASSLSKREELPSDHSYALWLKYNLIGERDARGLPRIFVSYEQLMDDWRGAIARCIAELRAGIAVRPETAADVDAFLTPKLHHHHAPAGVPGLFDRRLADLVLRTYALLQKAAAGTPRASLFDAIFNELLAAGHASALAATGSD